jgi:hypothetical protein
MCIFGACARRIDLTNESWIDENKTRGKNEVNRSAGGIRNISIKLHLGR